MANVNLSKINKVFGSTHIIKDLDLEVGDGEFVVFVGPSGCGKSTLLRLIAGLESITDGDMHFADDLVNDLPPRERGVGMVFQSYALYPHMTVYENMAFGLKLAKTDKQSIEQRVMETARILQLEELLQRKPKELSGGQRQRVAMGRAMAREPRILLFDEPLSNLDASLRVQMRNEIARLHHRLGSTMIYVTHDQVEAMTMADKIVVLRDGRIEQVGSPLDLYRKPDNKFVAGFIGSPKMNFLEGEEAAKYGAHTIGIRPEHLVLVDQGGWSGKVGVIEHLGSDTFMHVHLDNGLGTVNVRTDGDNIAKAGNMIAVAPIDQDRVYRFDKDGMAIR